MLPGSGGTQRLPRLIGQGRALHMILTGEKIDATTTLNWGLVTRIVPIDQLRKDVLSFANAIADNAPLAMHFAKFAVNQSTDISLDNGIRSEVAFQAILRSSQDCREGIQAFKEKCKPNYMRR